MKGMYISSNRIVKQLERKPRASHEYILGLIIQWLPGVRAFTFPSDVLAALENTAAAMNTTPEKLLEQIVRERLMPRVNRE